MQKKVEERIRKSINVNRHKVIIAKSFLMNYESEVIETLNVLEEFTVSQGFPKPKEIVIHQSVDIDEQVIKTSKYIAYKIAFLESVMELIHSNLLISLDTNSSAPDGRIGWTTVIPGQGGTSSGWNFADLGFPIPNRVRKSRNNTSTNFTLFEPDLFIEHLDIKNADAEIIEALNDSIDCFKQGLYRPSLAMLGKAVEGAWIELGISLYKYVISQGISKDKNEKHINSLKGQISFVKKVELVTNLYTIHHKDWLDFISTETDVKTFELREAQSWTDLVRESRNAIHFGVKPSVENNYEKNSMMLLASVKYFKM
ncbi:hypothetical protein ACXYMX_16730 [Sporosarcina sp. CAU 1771]